MWIVGDIIKCKVEISYGDVYIMWIRKNIAKRDILLFLDVDGVLNTSNSFNTKYEIHEENIEMLGLLIDKLLKCGYTSKVILTSTWRLGFEPDFTKCSPQIQRLISKLAKVNIKISGITPIYKGKTRDVEIIRYIRGYELENENFTHIILDDDISVFDRVALKELNFFQVNQHTGLTKKDVDKIIKMVV